MDGETQAEYWARTFAVIEAWNIAAGRCTACGGSGVVADMRAIDRTGDPHINKRCTRCKGDGKYRRAERG